MTNVKTTKRALLSSVVALFLCFAMLLGTTYAWFTDEVTSANNTIVSGNLNIELYHSDNLANEERVDGQTVLFDAVELWEPGAMVWEELTVKNEGSLALKYQLALNVLNATEIDGVSFTSMLKVAFIEDGLDEYNRASVEAISADKWQTLETFMIPGELEKNGDSDVYGIVIWWQPTDNDNLFNMNNENKGKEVTVEVGVRLFATQLEAEFDSFGDGYDADAALPEVITNATDLAAALTANEKEISVALYGDIDLPISSLGQQTGGSGEYKLGGEDTESIVIDLNGHKLNITTTYWSNIGAKNANATMTIKNGTMTSSQPTGTWNSYDLTFSNCDYVFENVTFDKAVAFDNEGKSVSIKNVTVNETHDYYAMWITAEGQNVTIDGLTVNSDNGRGIKIDEQYVDAPAKVALNISNAKFNTAKKAAIIVKSAAGADIALSNVNVSNTVDPIHAVWVDEDAASYADLVTVTGGAVVVEGSDEIPVANSVAANTTVTMGSVITAGGTTVIKNAGAIDLSGTPNLNGGDVIINGGTVVTTSQNYTGLQHAGEVTYNDVTFNGSTFLYGEKVVFNNCTFNLTSNYIWTYGAEEVEFNNCTFNTNGKAVLIYTEGSSTNKVVTIKDCTFNATTSGFASAVPGQPCAAVEIDSSLISGSYTVNFVGENVVDSDFSGLVRIKAGADKNNVTINGATAVDLP